MKKAIILEIRLFYVYLKTLMFSKRFWVVPFVYRILFDIRHFKLINFNVIGRSDCFTIMDVFCYQNYSIPRYWRDSIDRFLREGENLPVVLDLGANLGFTSHYIKKLYPEAFTIGVEPDRKAAQFCRQHGVDQLRTAVIGKGSKAFLSNDAISYQKKLSDHGDEVDVISENELVMAIGDYLPFILKVDIEGAEEVLFYDYQALISMFKVIFIELHDWGIDHKIHSTAIWTFLAESSSSYNVIIQGDILCLIKNT